MIARTCAALVAAVLLAGCGGRFATDYGTPVARETAADWTLESVEVIVPDTLTVSDRNVLAPGADIVWHGDPEGDRRAQVAAILQDGITQGAAGLEGSRPVTIRATLQEFHAVTPRAVSTAPSAVHNISYTIDVRDAATGATLAGPQPVEADLEAYTGDAAVVAVAEGRTQKARIQTHIARVTAAWLGLGEDVRRRFVTIGR